MSTKFAIESGACTGRGFATIDANGFLAKFLTWATTACNPPTTHGAGWTLLDDFSDIAAKTFATTDVDIATEIITITGHGFPQFCQVTFSSTDTLPAGLVAGTSYWINRIDAGTIYVYDNIYNCTVGSATGRVNLTSAGTGTHTMTTAEYFVILCDTASPTVNDYNTGPSGLPPKYIRVGYLSTESGYVRMQGILHWNSTTKTPYGFWFGQRLETYDSAAFAYDFRGGDECMFWASKLGSSWCRMFIDEWTGISSLVESTTTIGIVQSGVTAGSSVVLQLDSGESANFTKGKYYYIYDFVNHCWVNYAECTDTAETAGTSLSADQITLSVLYEDFPSGAVVCSYAHRFNGYGGGSVSLFTNPGPWINTGVDSIPYCSSKLEGRVTNDYGLNYSGGCQLMLISSGVYNDEILSVGDPDDVLDYYATRYLIREVAAANANVDTASMNRIYGKSKNWIRTYRNTMAQMLGYRTMDGKYWIDIDENATYVSCFLHSESAV